MKKISISKWCDFMCSCHSRFFLLFLLKKIFFRGVKVGIRKCCGLIFVYFTISLQTHQNADARCQYSLPDGTSCRIIICRIFWCNQIEFIGNIFTFFVWIFRCCGENICESCKNRERSGWWPHLTCLHFVMLRNNFPLRFFGCMKKLLLKILT